MVGCWACLISFFGWVVGKEDRCFDSIENVVFLFKKKLLSSFFVCDVCSMSGEINLYSDGCWADG